MAQMNMITLGSGGSAAGGGSAAMTGAQVVAAARGPVVEVFPGVTLPIPQSIQTIGQVVSTLGSAESASVELANRYILLHNAGRLTPADYVAYDGMRHGLNNMQVSFLAGLRASLYATVGQAVGSQVMNELPWPGWLPRLERGGAPVALVTGAALSGGLGAAPIVIAGVVLGVLATVAIAAWAFDKFIGFLTRALAQYAFCRTSDAVMAQRERIYNDCVAAGGTNAQCAEAAAALNADIVAALRHLNDLNPSENRTPLIVGVSLALAAIAAGGIWVYVRKRRGKPIFPKLSSGTSGLRGTRYRGSKIRGRGVGAIKLRSLKDNVPSDYNLEV